MEGKFQSLRRHKGNQTMRYGQSIEYNRNNFLEKSSTKRGRETSSILFFKKIEIENISGATI